MSLRDSGQNYYEVLEVEHSAQHHEIVQAYQRAKEAYAPDSPALYTMFSKEEAAELRKLVEEAFLVLGNQTKRKEYDMLLVARDKKSAVTTLPDLGPIEEIQKQVIQDRRPNGGTTSHSNMNSTTAFSQNAMPATVPEGFSKTRLSVFEVKPEMEQEISAQTLFDGPFLRKVRQYKNINLEQLSKETRISRSYLAAVEGDDYDALPAAVFVRGFVAQMARVLGLNETAAIQSYMSRFKK